jgi:hypothetical protein
MNIEGRYTVCYTSRLQLYILDASLRMLFNFAISNFLLVPTCKTMMNGPKTSSQTLRRIGNIFQNAPSSD